MVALLSSKSGLKSCSGPLSTVGRARDLITLDDPDLRAVDAPDHQEFGHAGAIGALLGPPVPCRVSASSPPKYQGIDRAMPSGATGFSSEAASRKGIEGIHGGVLVVGWLTPRGLDRARSIWESPGVIHREGRRE
jgi:hypothetical protein